MAFISRDQIASDSKKCLSVATSGRVDIDVGREGEAVLNRRSLLQCGAAALVSAGVAGCSSASSRQRTSSVATPDSSSAASSATSQQEAASARIAESGLDRVISLETSGMAFGVGSQAIVVGDVDQASVDSILAIAENSVTATSQLANVTIDDPVLILLPRSAREYSAWQGLNTDVTADSAGVTVRGSSQSRPWIVLNQLIDGNAAQINGVGSMITSDVVYHETFHAISIPPKRIYAPAWILEGYAVWTSGHSLSITVGRNPKDPVLPTDAQIHSADNDPYYYDAGAFVAYLQYVYSWQTALSFYKAALAQNMPDVEALFKKYFGVTLPNAVAAWKRNYQHQLANLAVYN